MGYNNQLKQAWPGMKLGVNNDVNQGTKKAALHSMAGRASKVNPPNSHPSNPIHKAAAKEKPKIPTSQPQQQENTNPTPNQETETTPPAGSGNDAHDVNKIIVAIGAVLTAGVVFFSLGRRSGGN